ncbi:MAG: toll/interleukin-1 receptor domain-containing protein [Pseudomonadota bacterium]|nr:toll/interleukin-1 receptor domain-containing protein [Pseudomonadota bacterium]
MTSVFFSYTHKDEALRDELEAHLALMKRQNLIEGWHDRRIQAGADVDDTIKKELEAADIILLLVSSDFIASNYCYSKEMARAMERHEAGQARVIPVILRSCDWHSAPFGKLLAAPKDGKAVTTWPDRDVAFTDVAKQVRSAVESMSAAKSKTAAAAPSPASTSSTAGVPRTTAAIKSGTAQAGSARGSVQQGGGDLSPRSSNLRLKNEFTDLDKDHFVHECFDFMVRFFETSIDAVKARHPDVDGRVERIDSRRFAAALYRGGKAIAQCTVQRGGASFGGDGRAITFSYGASGHGNSFNEQLTVQASDQALYMRALGLGSFSGRQERQLSAEGGAELYWGMFIERAQS